MVLGELAFPAARWRIQSHVDHDGADIHTRQEIWELPGREYLTLSDIIDAVTRRGSQPVLAGSGRHSGPSATERPDRNGDGGQWVA
jgi:hypothetical protein